MSLCASGKKNQVVDHLHDSRVPNSYLFSFSLGRVGSCLWSTTDIVCFYMALSCVWCVGSVMTTHFDLVNYIFDMCRFLFNVKQTKRVFG